jgi:hypothetical protein
MRKLPRGGAGDREPAAPRRWWWASFEWSGTTGLDGERGWWCNRSTEDEDQWALAIGSLHETTPEQRCCREQPIRRSSTGPGTPVPCPVIRRASDYPTV